MRPPSSLARSASGTTTYSAAPSSSHYSRPSCTTPGPGRKKPDQLPRPDETEQRAKREERKPDEEESPAVEQIGASLRQQEGAAEHDRVEVTSPRRGCTSSTRTTRSRSS